eukprot:SM000014S00232  [mRNA]  locus=s14:61482:70026:- [translate_table: standard]
MAAGATSAHVRGTDWPPETPCVGQAPLLLPLWRSRRIAARDEQRRELKFLEEVRRPSEQSPAEPEPLRWRPPLSSPLGRHRTVTSHGSLGAVRVVGEIALTASTTRERDTASSPLAVASAAPPRRDGHDDRGALKASTPLIAAPDAVLEGPASTATPSASKPAGEGDSAATAPASTAVDAAGRSVLDDGPSDGLAAVEEPPATAEADGAEEATEARPKEDGCVDDLKEGSAAEAPQDNVATAPACLQAVDDAAQMQLEESADVSRDDGNQERSGSGDAVEVTVLVERVGVDEPKSVVVSVGGGDSSFGAAAAANHAQMMTAEAVAVPVDVGAASPLKQQPQGKGDAAAEADNQAGSGGCPGNGSKLVAASLLPLVPAPQLDTLVPIQVLVKQEPLPDDGDEGRKQALKDGEAALPGQDGAGGDDGGGARHPLQATAKHGALGTITAGHTPPPRASGSEGGGRSGSNSAATASGKVVLPWEKEKDPAAQAEAERRRTELASAARKAREDFILEEAEAIKAAQRQRQDWARRRPAPETPRRKCQWDYVLEEMAWLANDFAQERLWKRAAAAQVSRWVAQARRPEEFRQRELEQQQRCAAARLAGLVQGFWQAARATPSAQEEHRQVEAVADAQVSCLPQGRAQREDKERGGDAELAEPSIVGQEPGQDTKEAATMAEAANSASDSKTLTASDAVPTKEAAEAKKGESSSLSSMEVPIVNDPQKKKGMQVKKYALCLLRAREDDEAKSWHEVGPATPVRHREPPPLEEDLWEQFTEEPLYFLVPPGAVAAYRDALERQWAASEADFAQKAKEHAKAVSEEEVQLQVEAAVDAAHMDVLLEGHSNGRLPVDHHLDGSPSSGTVPPKKKRKIRDGPPLKVVVKSGGASYGAGGREPVPAANKSSQPLPAAAAQEPTAAAAAPPVSMGMGSFTKKQRTSAPRVPRASQAMQRPADGHLQASSPASLLPIKPPSIGQAPGAMAGPPGSKPGDGAGIAKRMPTMVSNLGGGDVASKSKHAKKQKLRAINSGSTAGGRSSTSSDAAAESPIITNLRRTVSKVGDMEPVMDLHGQMEKMKRKGDKEHKHSLDGFYLSAGEKSAVFVSPTIAPTHKKQGKHHNKEVGGSEDLLRARLAEGDEHLPLDKAGAKLSKEKGGRKGEKHKKKTQSSAAAGSLPWSGEEDKSLLAMVHDLGLNWDLVSDVLGSITQLKGVYRKPKQCRDRHKALIDKLEGGEGDEASDDQRGGAFPGLPKGSARALLQRLHPQEEDTLKEHLSEIVRLEHLRRIKRKAQEEAQRPKDLCSCHISHSHVVSQAITSSNSGMALPMPLELLEEAVTSGEVAAVPLYSQAAPGLAGGLPTQPPRLDFGSQYAQRPRLPPHMGTAATPTQLAAHALAVPMPTSTVGRTNCHSSVRPMTCTVSP